MMPTFQNPTASQRLQKACVIKQHIARWMRAIWDLIIDYAQNSSINGLQYLFEQHRHWAEYLWWTVAMALALAGSSLMIADAYDKWQQTPIIVSVNERATPIWDVPFPAVTVCSETKTRPEVLNYTQVLSMLRNGKHLTHKQRRQVLALQQVCSAEFYELLNTTSDADRDADRVDTVPLLREMAPLLNETMWSCLFRNEKIECSEYFSEVLTSEGVCYTFNMLSPQELYREGISTDFPTTRNQRAAETWTSGGGYVCSADQPIDAMSYPFRMFGAGEPIGLQFVMQKPDVDWMCRGAVQGYRVLIHSPDEQPRLYNHFVQLPLDTSVLVAVRPRVIETSDRLRNYAPSLRQCFFPQEKYLRFFRVYKQRNCELECLANFTLAECGCAMFSMPRDQHTPLCNIGQLPCAEKAEIQVQMQAYLDSMAGVAPEKGCNCLSECTMISYDLEISQAPINWRETAREVNQDPDWQPTFMSVFFKHAQFFALRRCELVGPTDFLANCGGVIGLFMGFSVLSIVEMVYYCSLRLACNMRNRREYRAKPETFDCVKKMAVKVLGDVIELHDGQQPPPEKPAAQQQQRYNKMLHM